MTRAINPTGSMLLDRSTANPGSIDKSIFEKKSGSSSDGTARTGGRQAVSQGTVNPNYLKECREDNPEPGPRDGQTESVVLGNCKITTPPDNLVINQPFEMAVEAKAAKGAPSGQVTFRLFCTIPDCAGGPPKCEDQSLLFSGKLVDGVAKASGKLISPKKPVASGTKLQYHVVAKHPEANEKCESPKVEVEAGKPPKPLAVWSLGAVHFGFDSSFVMPSAAGEIVDFKAKIEKHPGAAFAVFGHADPVGEDDKNKGLSGRRAFAVWCLLAKDPTGWTQLANSDKWDLRTTQTMLAHLKNKTSGQPYYTDDIDGKTGPNTESAIASFRKDHTLGNGSNLDGKSKEGLFKAYMESVCEVTCKREDFVGAPKDAKHQWACVGCSEFNPVLVFGKADDTRFRNASDKTERNAKNAANRRATVFLFPPGAKGPGNVEFPCPQWSEGVSACRKQFFEDADKRRNPSDAERTWEKDEDTFACKFYAGLSGEIIAHPTATTQTTGTTHAINFEFNEAHFRSNSAVILPEGESPSNIDSEHQSLLAKGIIASVLEYNQHTPGKGIMIGGHTDSVGSEQANQELSEERALVALAMLTGDRTQFAKLCHARHVPSDLGQILDWSCKQYGFDCPSISPELVPEEASFHGFRTSYNRWLDSRNAEQEPDPRGTGHIADSGGSDPELWGAVFDLYEHDLRQELRQNSSGVTRLRESLRWLNPSRKTIGFGEQFPRDHVGMDNSESLSNRRIEIWFMEPDQPTPQSPPTPLGAPARVTVEVKLSTGEAVEGTAVSIDIAGVPSIQSTTGASGRTPALYPLAPKSARISVYPPGVLAAQARTVQLVARKDYLLTFIVSRQGVTVTEASIDLTVLSRRESRPVPNAQIAIGEAGQVQNIVATTNSAGKATIFPLVPGRTYSVTASPPAGGGYFSKTEEFTPQFPGDELTIFVPQDPIVNRTESFHAEATDILRRLAVPILKSNVKLETYTSLSFGLIFNLTYEDDINRLMHARAKSQVEAQMQARIAELQRTYGDRLIDVRTTKYPTSPAVEGWTTPNIDKQEVPGSDGKETETWTWHLSVGSDATIEYSYNDGSSEISGGESQPPLFTTLGT